MYHAARAVAYLSNQGDDLEAHDKVAGGLPANFPNLAQWQNALKDARLRRNEADYDPYPTGERNFVAVNRALLAGATEFSRECEAFLRANGCPL
jgi:hypothetical protein